MSNFEAVGEFHSIFGHPKNDVVQKDIFETNPKLVNFRVDLVREEFGELEQAAKNGDMKEFVDALGDILYVVYGAGHVLGVNMDKAFRIVHESNMSKLCKNETEADESIEHYKTLEGFENVRVGKRLSSCGNYYVVFNEDTGKILKSKYFNLPDFSELL